MFQGIGRDHARVKIPDFQALVVGASHHINLARNLRFPNSIINKQTKYCRKIVNNVFPKA